MKIKRPSQALRVRVCLPHNGAQFRRPMVPGELGVQPERPSAGIPPPSPLPRLPCNLSAVDWRGKGDSAGRESRSRLQLARAIYAFIARHSLRSEIPLLQIGVLALSGRYLWEGNSVAYAAVRA